MTSRHEGEARRNRRRSLRLLLDLTCGAGLFLLLLTLCGHLPDVLSPSRASAMGLEATSAGLIAHGDLVMVLAGPAAPAKAALATPAMLVILGLTFSVLFTFNAGLCRHLRRAYASPRRDGWGRDC